MHSRSKLHAALISSKRCRSLGLSWPTATPRRTEICPLPCQDQQITRTTLTVGSDVFNFQAYADSTCRPRLSPSVLASDQACFLKTATAFSSSPHLHRHWTGNCPTNRPPWVHPKDQDMKPSSSAIMAVTKHPPSFTLSGPQGRHETMVLTFRRHLCRPTLSLGGDTQPELQTTGPLHYIQLASDSWGAGTRECGEWNGEFLSTVVPWRISPNTM